MKPSATLMKKAIESAVMSAAKSDYAVGAIITKGKKIIAVGETRLNRENDPTVHAEIVAIRRACRKLKSRFLDGCILYTTHEPCVMCAGAAIWAKMDGVVFGAFIRDAKKHSSKKYSWRQIDISCKTVLQNGTPKLDLAEGFMRKECLKLFELSQ